MNMKEIGRKGVDWIPVVQGRGQLLASVKAVIYLRVPQRSGSFVPQKPLVPQKVLSSM